MHVDVSAALAPWTYLTEWFPGFRTQNCVCPGRLDIRKRDNITGHQQRLWGIEWALKKCGQTGLPGLELGSAGIYTPWCLSTDVRTGLHSHYPPNKPVAERGIVGGHLRVDAAFSGDTRMRRDTICGDEALVFGTGIFPANAFGAVLANHVLEHIENDPVDTLVEWLRVLRSGGAIVLVLPDNRWFDVMACDPDHKHAWSGDEFSQIARRVPGARVIEETYQTPNYHSFLTVLEKI